MGVTLTPRTAPRTTTTTPLTTSTNAVTSTLPTTSTTATKKTDVYETAAAKPAATTTTAWTPPKRRLPALRTALVDPTVPAVALASLAVPQDVVDVLATAKRVLVIGHANPADGDCVGSALALKHGLASLGKDVVAVVDQALPRHLRALDRKSELRRASDDDVTRGGFDVVVLVDVAQSHRIGDMAPVVQAAPHVLVIDHHDEPHVETSAGAADDARLTHWIDVDKDAAAVQVGAAVAAVAKATGKDVDAAVAACRDDVAAGLYTDTLGMTAPGTDPLSLQVLKGVLGDTKGLDALEAKLKAPLPDDVVALVDGALSQQGKKSEPVLVVDGDLLDEALARLQQTEPQAVMGDLTGRVMNALDAAAQKASSQHAVLVMPTATGFRVSIRGPEALSLQKAISNDGGGKPGAAVANVEKGVDVVAAAKKALAALAQKQTAQLRLGR